MGDTRMPYNKPNWILLKECAEKLTREGKASFTRRHLIDCIHGKHPDRGEGSLNPMIQGMTVNRKGGAPGGIGKNVFYSIGRGVFELYDPKKHARIAEGKAIKPSVHEKIEEASASAETKTTEDEIRDLIMQVLYHRVGREGSWEGSGKTASFVLRDEFSGYKCSAERPLPYTLPTGVKMTHTSDILINNEVKERYISIEIKHRSAVTDQFKCRSYDMIHFKKSYEGNLLGIMAYIKSTAGISVEHAKSICYSFDHFFGIPSASRHTPTTWDKLISVIVEFLRL
jgi:hypothetical protein